MTSTTPSFPLRFCLENTTSRIRLLFTASKARTPTKTTSPPIPFEIVFQILQYLQSELVQIYGELLLTLHPSCSLKSDEARRKYRDFRRPLYFATLVSRIWCSAGTPLLYSHPILFNPYQLRVFERTATSSPAAAASIRKLSILCDSIIQATFPTLLRPSPARQGQRITAHAIANIEVLPDLIELDLVLPRPHACLAALPRPLSNLGNLRKFTFEGHASWMSHFNPSLSLGALEELCIRSYQFNEGFRYPHLPRLHTLRLSRTHGWTDMQSGIILPHEHLPSLRTLQLHHNGHCEWKINRASLSSAPKLRSLDLVGFSDLQTFSRLSDYGVLSNLEYLLLCNFPVDSNPISRWVFPRTLKSLIVLVDLNGERDSWSFAMITRCLETNTRVGLPDVPVRIIVVIKCHIFRPVDLPVLFRARSRAEDFRKRYKSPVLDIECREVGSSHGTHHNHS